ncbi:MAG: EscU/YscU/HrcU family type III secretion system export apparatus switch protein [Treponema sp.]|nr:EscU/YscU/HrcU family type III secretion system export apparatus switch protein [Treponema sp.]
MDLQWFAAEDEGRTEKPSESKLRKSREEGQVAKSVELNGSLVYFFAVVLLIFLAPWMEKQFEELMVFFFNNSMAEKIDDSKFFSVFLRFFLSLVLPFCAVGLTAGVAANIVQNRGFIFTTKTIRPKLSKIFPNFKEFLNRTVFSVIGFFNLVKSIVKVAVIGVTAFFFIKSDMDTTLKFLQTNGMKSALNASASMAARLLIMSAVFLLAVGILDYVMQRRQFMERMKMTKQQVKEEFKEQEGDPEQKARLQKAQREMLMQNLNRTVREADVVITNPTHYAVALEWKRERSDAPEVTAKGEDLTAQRIKTIAREAEVPVVENRALARGLYDETEVGDMIPVSYMRLVATVYAEIGYMEQKGKKS